MWGHLKIIETGKDYVYLNHENKVCGVLRWLDDTMVIRPPTRAENRNLKVVRDFDEREKRPKIIS